MLPNYMLHCTVRLLWMEEGNCEQTEPNLPPFFCVWHVSQCFSQYQPLSTRTFFFLPLLQASVR